MHRADIREIGGRLPPVKILNLVLSETDTASNTVWAVRPVRGLLICRPSFMNRKSGMLCLNKYLKGGVDNALFDVPWRGRNAEITDDETAWIFN